MRDTSARGATRSANTIDTGAAAGMPGYLLSPRAPAEINGGLFTHRLFEAGEPAPYAARTAAERLTGVSLAEARLHTGESVDAVASTMRAQAYTVGRDVHVARKAYNPYSAVGNRLLVHELVHAAQQGSVAVPPGTRVPISDPLDASEQQAESLARHVARDSAHASIPAPLQRTAPRAARAVAEKQTKGIDLTAADSTADFDKRKARDYWWQKLFGLYAAFSIGTDRLKTDPEESDAVGAVAFAEHLKLPLPLRHSVTRLVTIPLRTAKTKAVAYRLTFSPPVKGDPRPRLGFEFLTEGPGVKTATASAPASGPNLPSSWMESGFPAGGLKSYTAKFKDEVGQLFAWVDNSAPSGAFSQLVHTTTIGTSGKTAGQVTHESTFLVKGNKSTGSVGGIEVQLLGNQAPATAKAPADYRSHDNFDLGLEELQARKTDALGTITGLDKVPADEASTVKFAIWQYFKTGTRNAEVDAIVPISGTTRRLLYTLEFEGKTNNVRVTRIGEAGKDVELDPAKRKLDVQRVRGFNARADTAGLKSWLAGRYPAVKASGSTPAELIKNVNTTLNADADASPWFASNYSITVLDETPAKAHLTKTHPTFFDAGQTTDVKNFKSGERTLLELALQLLSAATLRLIRGITLIRQNVRLQRIVGKARRGQPAPVSYRPKTSLGGETFTTGKHRTVVLYDNMYINDPSLFIGDKASGGGAQPLPLSAMTIEHELGHVVGGTAKIQDAFNAKFVAARSKLKAAPATWYAKGAPGDEFFPEAFAIYNGDPAWMLANLPDMHAWFETLSNTGTAPP